MVKAPKSGYVNQIDITKFPTNKELYFYLKTPKGIYCKGQASIYFYGKNASFNFTKFAFQPDGSADVGTIE
jgi:hypothetical protein